MSYTDFVAIAAVVSALLLFAAPIAPVVYYVYTAWKIRRSEIVGDLNDEGIALYFLQYYTTISVPNDKTQRRKFFEKYYGARYGRRHFLLPLGFLIVISGILSIFVIHAAFDLLTGNTVIGDFSPIVLAAVTGGFMGAMVDVVGAHEVTSSVQQTSIGWICGSPCRFLSVLRSRASSRMMLGYR